MKRVIINSTILLIGIIVFVSCRDFLSTQPSDRITEDNFWNKISDAENAVNAIYRQIPGEYYLWLDATTDNAYARGSTSLAQSLGNGTQSTNAGLTPFPPEYWESMYIGIQKANYLLENIDKVSGLSEGLKNRYIGEARFLRAFFYNDLMHLFGDVPLITSTLELNEGEVSRDPEQEVYDFIVSELNTITDFLPLNYDQRSKGRITRGAVLAFKARVYLQQNEFQNAGDAAQDVMKLGIYSLYPDYAELFSYEGENNSEVIFDQQFILNDFDHNVSELLAPRSSSGESQITPLKSLLDAYQMADGQTINESQQYDPQSPYENRDPRLKQTIITPGSMWDGSNFVTYPGSESVNEIANGQGTSFTGMNFKKYVQLEDLEGGNNNGSVNLIMIRYAEVLLTYAESKIETNNIDMTVYDAINAIRKRAGMPIIEQGKSQQELREIVRRERRVELALEGLRFFDIRRWGIIEEVRNGPAYGIDYVENGELQSVFVEDRVFNSERGYLWPIPERELQVNPSLTQNPGY